IISSNRSLIVRLAVRHHLPAIYASLGFVSFGGLISYGSDQITDYRRAASYVDTMLCHLRAPALLMRAHALATVREWKKRLEHKAHSRSKSRGGCGLPVATGAV